MERIIKKASLPEHLNIHWDLLADFYFQKTEFLAHLHRHNPCAQRYYELYRDGLLVAATVVYTLKVNLLTFVNIPSPFKVQIIGIPVSVATPPMIGDPAEFEYFLLELISKESGLILGVNFEEDYLKGKVLNLRTLPTVILNLEGTNLTSYEKALTYNYRRRFQRIREKFSNVHVVKTDCSAFSEEHYGLYLEIMKKTTTKLETLSLNAFRELPTNFILTTYYTDKVMLCWNVICKDVKTMFFFFGGMNYLLRDQYQSYNNNLIRIISAAFENEYAVVDFGQTAEVAKTRLGGKLSERRMFAYHKNPLVLYLLCLFKNAFTYSKLPEICHVFKVSNESNVKN
jgi:hypothetical protein